MQLKVSSPHAQTKNGKERVEPGIIYHVSNAIGRELDYIYGPMTVAVLGHCMAKVV